MATKRSSNTSGQPKRGLALLSRPGFPARRYGQAHLRDVEGGATRLQRGRRCGRLFVSKLCFEGSEEELEATVNTQPAIVATSLAYLAELRERLSEKGRQMKPSFVAGHSLGQFSAAVAAGALAFSDGLQIVMERGRIMGRMVAQPAGRHGDGARATGRTGGRRPPDSGAGRERRSRRV